MRSQMILVMASIGVLKRRWVGVGEIPDGHRWHSSPKIRFAPDSLVEGTGFEPPVPRERLVPSFSFTPTFPLARVNRPDPIPKAYIMRGPMVRIRLPPAGRWYGAG